MGKDKMRMTNLGLINVVSRASFVEANKQFKNSEITSKQGLVLKYINANPGLIQRDIAEAFHKRGATITSMLKTLEKNELINRVRDADNERIKKIYISDKGKEIISNFDNKFMKSEKIITDTLTEDEQDELHRLLKKIVDGLPTDDIMPPGRGIMMDSWARGGNGKGPRRSHGEDRE